MPAIKTILFPTDFSETSTHAFDYACERAQENRAKLVALHVVEPTPPLVADGVVLPFDDEAARNAAQEELGRLEPTRSSLKFDRVLREGPAAKTIAETADELNVDLIVMGTHGRGGIRRLVLGSVAEQVLRLARCPVLFVKQSHPVERSATARHANAVEAGAGI